MRKAVPGGLVVLVAALLSACSPSGPARTGATVAGTRPPVRATTSTAAPTTTTTVALPP